jgi:hypothetical protein
MPAPSDAGAHRAAYDALMRDLLQRAAARLAARAETQPQEVKEIEPR